MNVKDLMNLNAFVPDGIVKKQITFSILDEETNEEKEYTHDIFVRRLSIGIHEGIWADSANKSKTAKLLAEAVRLGENGEERMTYDQAFSLHPNVALAMSKAVNEVNGGERKN